MCVLIGIIAFFVLILSIPVKVSLSFDNKIRLSIKYLFIKLDILPAGPKKEKAPKPKKEPEPKPEKPADEAPKEKKPNPIL